MNDIEIGIDGGKPEDLVEYWNRQLEREKKAHTDYKEWAEKGEKAYKAPGAYNICWPTVSITSSALYSSTPTPDVQRRQRTGDKDQKNAAAVIERSIDFSLDNHDFDGGMVKSVNDFLIAGMGQARIVYKVETGQVPGDMVDPETGKPMMIEDITAQRMEIEHYSWKHFGWEPSKAWADVGWVYFTHSMKRKEILDKYQVDAAEDESEEDGSTYANIYEIYDKTSRTVIVIADQFKVPLEIRQDQLELEGFFPCPEPMATNVLTDKYIPYTDFKYYHKQYTQLNVISERVNRLTNKTNTAAFYDSSFSELAKLPTSKDGQFIPVEDLIAKLEGTNRLESIIAEQPMAAAQGVMAMLMESKEYLQREVFEILGIGDIMRGESNPQDGVETNKLKSAYGTLRIRQKQGTVDRFCRDIFRLMAEVIAEHFEPAVLGKVSGIEMTPEIVAILKDDFLRNVSIDIETSSTNAVEMAERKREEVDSLQSLITGFTELFGAMQQGVMPEEVGRELMLMIVSAQGYTGNIEEILSGMGNEDPGDPEMVINQLKQQLMQAEEQMAGMQQALEEVNQVAMRETQSKTQLNEAKAQKTMAEIPGEMAETELTQVEAQGKRVEQAGNIAANMQGVPVNLVGIE